MSTGVAPFVPFSTESGMPSLSLSVSKKSGVPSPSVSTGTAPFVPFSTESGMPSLSLSKSR